MSDTHDAIVFMRNPKISKMAKIQLGLGIALGFLTFIILALGIPVVLPLASALLMVVVGLIILSREDTPVCTIRNNTLEFKSPAPLGALQLIPLNTILSVSRQKRRFVVESSYQRKPVYLPIETFKPGDVERLWKVLSEHTQPSTEELAV
ncbi:hypothetical protein [Saccharospirillum alexandrii]|uniref:hypothetical protein n=1 Tax=Saccharospirillum alexandrii TaxID=2448477 RepID=UPI000FD81A56|nr:hypothetical protein [Saccharospirillum alexandrii]